MWYGIRPPGTPDELLARAVAAAGRADTVLLLVGETSDASVESKDRRDTRLPAEQSTLVERVAAANPRTVAIANVGHAFDASWDGRVAAHLAVWYPGQAFAEALADVISGDIEPGGRLAVTLAAREEDYPGFSLEPDADGALHYEDGVLPGYRGLAARGVAPRHAFGSGLGYAVIELSDARIERGDDGGAIAYATLHNASARAGSQVVQVYRKSPEPALAGFEKVRLAPGETREVAIAVSLDRLRTWDGEWRRINDPSLVIGLSAAVLY